MWRDTFKHNNTPIVKKEYSWGCLISTGTLIMKYRNETGETLCWNDKTKDWDKWPVLNPKMEGWDDNKQLAFNY